jgi:NAD(P)-dependent dehydrogenase (short-subunit alcohol dehydrogenase family)
MFDAGQQLPSPYHRTKFESERLVRELSAVPWRVYRPAVVVGHSQTGEMDKIDGPYYFFSAIKRAGRFAPEWLPLVGPDLGTTNIVPVDYVAGSIDHLAHVDGLDNQAFHLTDPDDVRAEAVINAFARAAGAPQFALRIDKRVTDAIPRSLLSITLGLPVIKQVAGAVLRELDIPAEVVGHIALQPHFDTTKTRAALAGSGLHVPPLASYADKLWDYWSSNLDPGLVDRSLVDALHGRTVVITGASSGIGRTLALKVAAAGGIPILVARGKDKLDALKQEIEGTGGMAYVESCDLSDMDAIGDLVERLDKEHPRIDFLVNNAGRSIRRSVKLSYDRFHDYERTMSLNYFGAIRLILGLLPKMSENKGGHIVNVSSIGVQTNPPRFSAYVASKAALDAFSRVVASETFGDNITFTTIHMPLVRTPMIAPTKLYDSFPTITPDEAADLVCDALRGKPKHIGTKLGTFGEVAYALVPKRVDQVLHLAYKVFPDSSAARGEPSAPTEPERVSAEARALARMLPGVHW